MVSFIVPAHNEEASLGRTLEAIHKSTGVLAQPYEIIVVDDASTDATSTLASQKGARVVHVSHRQIAATRNSGARAAHGDRLFFVDADTTINGPAVATAMRAMDNGAVGGGGAAWIASKERVPLYARIVMFVLAYAPKLVGFTGGAFMFCTREAFAATGGFNERLYWAEEGGFALALKREGRFFVPWHHVYTSGRRFRKITGLELLLGGIRMLFSPVRFLTERSSVAKVWYDSDRADDDRMPNSLLARISNGLALLIILVIVTGWIWDFVPWRITPWSSLIGKCRYAIAVFLCHLGLLAWLPGLALLLNVLKQKRATGLLQTGTLVTFCFWQASQATREVIYVWGSLLGWAKSFIWP